MSAARATTLPNGVPGVAADALALRRTLPGGPLLSGVVDTLQRGSVIACCGDAPLAGVLALIAGASQQGSWTAVAGQPTLGIAAALEAGVDVSRLIAVHDPQGVSLSGTQWAEVLAAMIDGFDLVVAGAQTRTLPAGLARRVQARAQRRGALLVTVGEHPTLGADLQVRATTLGWHGLGAGSGCAARRELQVEIAGRRLPRRRTGQLVWPVLDVPFC